MAEERRKTDRRNGYVDQRRRNFDRREKTFHYDREIYLGDTNMMQNVYFANFFLFMGEARECFLKFLLGDSMETFFKEGYLLVTVDAAIKFLKSLFVFDMVRIKISVSKLTRTKIFLHFNFINLRDNVTVASGDMTIGVLSREGKPIIVPEPLSLPLSKLVA